MNWLDRLRGPRKTREQVLAEATELERVYDEAHGLGGASWSRRRPPHTLEPGYDSVFRTLMRDLGSIPGAWTRWLDVGLGPNPPRRIQDTIQMWLPEGEGAAYDPIPPARDLFSARITGISTATDYPLGLGIEVRQGPGLAVLPQHLAVLYQLPATREVCGVLLSHPRVVDALSSGCHDSWITSMNVIFLQACVLQP